MSSRGASIKRILAVNAWQDIFQGGQVNQGARAPHDADQMAGGYEIRRAVPGWKVAERIAAHEVDQPGTRVLPGQEINCIHSVVRAGAGQLNIGKLELRVICNGQFHHRQTVFERGEGLALFMRRIGCQNPQQTVKSKPGVGFRGQDQVAEMGWVEGPAKNADGLHK